METIKSVLSKRDGLNSKVYMIQIRPIYPSKCAWCQSKAHYCWMHKIIHSIAQIILGLFSYLIISEDMKLHNEYLSFLGSLGKKFYFMHWAFS